MCISHGEKKKKRRLKKLDKDSPATLKNMKSIIKKKKKLFLMPYSFNKVVYDKVRQNAICTNDVDFVNHTIPADSC